MEYKILSLHKMAKGEPYRSCLVEAITTSAIELKKAFGKPTYSTNKCSTEKVRYEWVFKVTYTKNGKDAEQCFACIYDYKEYRRYGQYEQIEFHIGSNNDDKDFVKALKEGIQRMVINN